MQRLVDESEARGGDWGFKDPLTCLTYPMWRSVLPAHRVVGVYRGPEQVMRHYHVRGFDPFHASRVLRAWARYSAGMLDALADSDTPGVLIRYEELMRDQSEFDRLNGFVGGGLVDARRASQHRAKRGHRLFGPVAAAMAAFTDVAPRSVLADLDRTRIAQATKSIGG